MEQQCDLVYLWVDGNAPDMVEKRNFWLKKYNKPVDEQAINNCRFIDNEELRYSLRSVEMYAPWINNIYIITDNQVPKWLNVSHPKIHIVDHTEIMPPDALPTFCSMAIEACAHKIKGLCEFFLLANDDMFFANPTEFNFFFDEKNYPIFRINKNPLIIQSMYGKHLYYSYNLINEKFKTEYDKDPDHNITPYRKSIIEECIENFKEEFDYTVHCKFREPNCVERVIYSAYGCVIGKTVTKSLAISKAKKIMAIITNSHKKDSIYFTTASKNIIRKIKKYKPCLICINDTETTLPEHRAKLKTLLEIIFPQKSEFEL